MKKILVAIDFSEASRNATHYAANLAKSIDAELVLLNSFFVAIPSGDFPGYLPTSFAELLQQQEALMQTEIEQLSKTIPVKMEGFVRAGMAADVIADVAAELEADLVVMGMKGGGSSNAFFGSTVISAARKTPKPLLIIPDQVTYKHILQICFAADFGKWPNEENYKTLVEIMRMYNARINIVHVEKIEAKMSADMVSGKIRADLLFDKVDHNFHTIINDSVEKGVSDFLAENPANMLVMVAHKHNFLERLFGTVHTKLMAYQTDLPLLVLHD